MENTPTSQEHEVTSSQHVAAEENQSQNQSSEKKVNQSGEQAVSKEGIWGFIKSLEDLGDEYLVKKAPFQLPTNVKDILVKIAPYAAILMVVVVLSALVPLLGAGGYLARHFYFRTFGGVLTTLFLVASLIVEILSISPLFKREKKGRDYLFLGMLISFLSSVFSGNVFGGIIGAIIGLYFLFQLKSYYKG